MVIKFIMVLEVATFFIMSMLLFGVFLPAMISAPSTFAVLVGIVAGFLGLAGLAGWCVSMLRRIKVAFGDF